MTGSHPECREYVGPYRFFEAKEENEELFESGLIMLSGEGEVKSAGRLLAWYFISTSDNATIYIDTWRMTGDDSVYKLRSSYGYEVTTIGYHVIKLPGKHQIQVRGR